MTHPDFALVYALAQRYKLALLETPARGGAGDVLARSVGHSVEFHDFRPYVPGDDPRYIDWQAYARTDALVIRLHRAEVRLSLDVILDTSRSMTVTDGVKAARARQIALLLLLLGQRAGARNRLWRAGDVFDPAREAFERILAEEPFSGRTAMAEMLPRFRGSFEIGSVRLVLSDFLFPHDPEELHAQLAQGATAVALVQIASREELAPPEGGPALLVDAETERTRTLALSRANVQRYAARLRNLQEGLSRACQRTHSPWAPLCAETPLEEICRDTLCRQGILRAAG